METTHLIPGLGAVVVALCAATSAASPSRIETELNAPELCPYCEGDPELMAASGILSHGGFEFATKDTHGIDEFLVTSDVRWVDTEHFELGFALGSTKISQKSRTKVRAELEELAKALPAINPKTRVLDPWLRTHLYARRVEALWDRFLEIMQVSEDDFPDGSQPWKLGTPYMGEGPYVGQKGKFEALVLPSEAVHVDFLREEFGLQITRTQRWNFIPRDSLIVVMHTEEGLLRTDAALHGHLAFNLSGNLLHGYKHYSYETPIWIHEGLNHFLEREIDPDFNSFDSSEGAIAEMTRKSDWAPEVREMIRAGDAPRMAELMSLRSFGELRLSHHYATWSMTVFLIEEHGEGYACLNDRLHGIKDPKGFADGSDMPGKHRNFFKECIGMSYSEFDRAWSEWALSQE